MMGQKQSYLMSPTQSTMPWKNSAVVDLNSEQKQNSSSSDLEGGSARLERGVSCWST